jgi:hypothetical protein
VNPASENSSVRFSAVILCPPIQDPSAHASDERTAAFRVVPSPTDALPVAVLMKDLRKTFRA